MPNDLTLITRQLCFLIGTRLQLEFKAEIDCEPIQTYVDFVLDAIELSQSLDDLSANVLTYVSTALLQRLNNGNAKYCYALKIVPSYCTIQSFNGCSIRGIVNRNFKTYDEEMNEKITNLFRFDVLWSA